MSVIKWGIGEAIGGVACGNFNGELFVLVRKCLGLALQTRIEHGHEGYFSWQLAGGKVGNHWFFFW